MAVILVLAGVVVAAAALQLVPRRPAAPVEAPTAKAEPEPKQAVAPLTPAQLAARLQEVQACNSEPRIGEPEAILLAYAECFGARIQETRVLGRAPVRVYVVTGGGSWTVEGGVVTGYRR
jgi:hypothetical protein